MAVTAGPRLGLTRWSAGTDPFRRAQLDADHATLDDLAVIHSHGLFNARPAAGIRGRFYYATDVGGGTLYYDNGSAWSSGVVLEDDTRLTDARTPTAHTHAAADVTSGVFGTARLGSGAASSSTYLRGDGTWAALPGSSLSALSDVAVSGLATAQLLRYNASTGKWENKALVIGDLPVAASGTSSATQVVRADDSRLSNARTPTAHSHPIGDLPVAASGASSSTALVRADDSRLSDARTPTTHTHTTAQVTGLDTALTAKADKANGTHTGTTTIGGADTDVEKLRSVVLEVDGRTITLTRNGSGQLTTVTEKAGATTVKTTTLTRSAGLITSVAETAGGQTATTTITRTAGIITGLSRSVA